MKRRLHDWRATRARRHIDRCPCGVKRWLVLSADTGETVIGRALWLYRDAADTSTGRRVWSEDMPACTQPRKGEVNRG